MKKMKSRLFRILMAAVISAAMLCPQVKVSAADGLVSKAATSYFPSKTVMKKTARKTEPEEWNQKEIKAYKFGTLEDALYYALTGGIKYYDQNYFKNPDLIKLTPVESGALGLAVVGDNKQEGPRHISVQGQGRADGRENGHKGGLKHRVADAGQRSHERRLGGGNGLGGNGLSGRPLLLQGQRHADYRVARVGMAVEKFIVPQHGFLKIILVGIQHL